MKILAFIIALLLGTVPALATVTNLDTTISGGTGATSLSTSMPLSGTVVVKGWQNIGDGGAATWAGPVLCSTLPNSGANIAAVDQGGNCWTSANPTTVPIHPDQFGAVLPNHGDITTALTDQCNYYPNVQLLAGTYIITGATQTAAYAVTCFRPSQNSGSFTGIAEGLSTVQINNCSAGIVFYGTPARPGVSQVTQGGDTVAAGTYYVRTTFTTAAGETGASLEIPVTVTTGNAIQISSPTLQLPTDATNPITGWKAYVTAGAVRGTETLQGGTNTIGNPLIISAPPDHTTATLGSGNANTQPMTATGFSIGRTVADTTTCLDNSAKTIEMDGFNGLLVDHVEEYGAFGFGIYMENDQAIRITDDYVHDHYGGKGGGLAGALCNGLITNSSDGIHVSYMSGPGLYIAHNTVNNVCDDGISTAAANEDSPIRGAVIYDNEVNNNAGSIKVASNTDQMVIDTNACVNQLIGCVNIALDEGDNNGAFTLENITAQNNTAFGAGQQSNPCYQLGTIAEGGTGFTGFISGTTLTVTIPPSSTIIQTGLQLWSTTGNITTGTLITGPIDSTHWATTPSQPMTPTEAIAGILPINFEQQTVNISFLNNTGTSCRGGGVNTLFNAYDFRWVNHNNRIQGNTITAAGNQGAFGGVTVHTSNLSSHVIRPSNAQDWYGIFVDTNIFPSNATAVASATNDDVVFYSLLAGNCVSQASMNGNTLNGPTSQALEIASFCGPMEVLGDTWNSPAQQAIYISRSTGGTFPNLVPMSVGPFYFGAWSKFTGCIGVAATLPATGCTGAPGNTLVVTGFDLAHPAPLAVGTVIYGDVSLPGVALPSGTTITALAPGTAGGVGQYALNNTQNISSEAMAANGNIVNNFMASGSFLFSASGFTFINEGFGPSISTVAGFNTFSQATTAAAPAPSILGNTNLGFTCGPTGNSIGANNIYIAPALPSNIPGTGSC